MAREGNLSADNLGGTCSEISAVAGSRVTFNWKFDTTGGAPKCGKFANGDWWVSPASGKTDVKVTAVSVNGNEKLYLDENPKIESIGFLSKGYTYKSPTGQTNWDPAENILPQLPLSYAKDVSLVAVAQRDEAKHGKCGTSSIVGACVGAYNILTILKQVPPNNGTDILRPSIDDDAKTLFSMNDFDLTQFPSKNYLTGANQAEIENIRRRWSHSTEIFGIHSMDNKWYSEGGRAFRASYLINDYSASVASRWNDDLMMLFSDDYNLDSKKPAIAAMLVYGKDLYDAIYEGETRMRSYGGGAGQGLNKYPPVAFFASLSKDPKYGNILKATTPSLLDKHEGAPLELEQINPGHNGPVWGDLNTAALTRTAAGSDLNQYWANMLYSKCYDGAIGTCTITSGQRTIRDPYGFIDGPEHRAGSAYFGVTSGPQKAFLATMSLMPKMCEIVNYPLHAQFVDRLVNNGVHTQPDPCAPPDPREPSTCDAYRAKGCSYYGLNNTGTATWGPDPKNPGMCILDPDLEYYNSPTDFKCKEGKTCGRFPTRHNVKPSPAYTSAQVETNWNKIRLEATGMCTLGATVNQPESPSSFTLTASTLGTGTGMIAGNTNTYTSGATATLTATASAGSVFVGWSGACTGTNTTCTVSMTSNKSVTATFNKVDSNTYTLTTPEINGTIAKTVSGVATTSSTFVSGTVVTLTATPASGYQFSSWSGCSVSAENVCVITMNSDLIVTANFTNSDTGNNTCSSVTQYGITWTFDKEYECGQFANGDYWIVGPAKITRITPDGISGRNGWNVNPIPGNLQPYDSRANGYSSSLQPQLPYLAQANQSIVKSVSRQPYDEDCKKNSPKSCLQTAAVLTVLSETPPNNGETVFRPSYTGNSKELYSANNLRTDLLLNLNPVADTPSINYLLSRIQRVQLDHNKDWMGENIHPIDNMTYYGAGMTSDYGSIMLRLSLNDNLQNKMPLLIGFVQAGIDYHGMLENGMRWIANGGHASGRKAPILFAGLMLNEKEMLDVGVNYPASSQRFAEDVQTFYTSENPPYVDAPNANCYSALSEKYRTSSGFARYGIKYGRDPSNFENAGEDKICKGIWSTYWGINAQSWVGQTLAMRLYDLTEEWNHQAYFDHLDRRIEINGFSGTWGNSFNNNMWNAYRNEVPTTSPVEVAPSILTHPQPQTIAQGTSATLSVNANGTQPLTYQWYRNNTAITGATSASYTTPILQLGQDASYYVRVTNSLGGVNSNLATVTVSNILPPATTNDITSVSAEKNLIVGQTYTATVKYKAKTNSHIAFTLKSRHNTARWYYQSGYIPVPQGEGTKTFTFTVPAKDIFGTTDITSEQLIYYTVLSTDGTWEKREDADTITSVYAKGGVAPQTPVITSPSNNTIYPSNTTNVTLAWTGDASNYIVRYTTNRENPITLNTTNKTYTIPVTAGNTYQFYVASGTATNKSTEANVNFSVEEENIYTLTVKKAGTGNGTISGNLTEYEKGEYAILTATPDSSSTFGGWSGCTSSSATACVIDMQVDTTVTATFTKVEDPTNPPATTNDITSVSAEKNLIVGQTYTATVKYKAKTNSYLSFNLKPAVDTSKSYYRSGFVAVPQGEGTKTFTFTVPAKDLSNTADITKDKLIYYVMLSSDGTSNKLTDYTLVTGVYAKGGVSTPVTYTLRTGVSGSGTVTEGGTYNSGTTVTVTATPASGYQFSSWSGCSSSTNTCTVTMNSNQTVTANFSLTPATSANSPAITNDITSVSAEKNIIVGQTYTATVSYKAKTNSHIAFTLKSRHNTARWYYQSGYIPVPQGEGTKTFTFTVPAKDIFGTTDITSEQLIYYTVLSTDGTWEKREDADTITSVYAKAPTISQTGTWTTIATEGKPFTVSANTLVRYGAKTSWIYKTVSGTNNCTNEFFGEDPLYRTVKACQKYE
jgi:uncharacterized repeat protein (TIGR02543 family)